MEHRTGARRWAWRAGMAALALAGWLTAAQAEDDDYTKGAKLYARGEVTAAMPLLKRAADAGHAGAQAMYADILDKAELDEEAIDYFRKSAAQGNADGQYGLGTMYASGQGVKRDPAEARAWITKAAEQGHALAINALAQAYIGGGLGLTDAERASEAALTWINRAADNKYLPAIDTLAAAYRDGKYGLAPDAKRAEQLAATARELRGIRKTEKRKKSSS